MKRSIIVLALCSLFSVPAFAQEAFYIYRHDGDFNGFFYDEVLEMRSSKIGVDSIEYDQWVTQEIVLADTVYRIPLAAIDSIGFQQPEIKINPNIRYMERDGYCPYFYSAYQYSHDGITFKNLPKYMEPKKGDVLIGLVSDSISGRYYNYYNSGNSFSCIVDSVGRDRWEEELTIVYGRPVEQIGDVIEQYIGMEVIGVDPQGNIHRRIAGGRLPDNMPFKVQQAQGEGELTLIDFTGTIKREWKPDENAGIDFSADVNFKIKLRAAYNITWKQFTVKLTRDFIMGIKPSLGISVTRGFDLELKDVFYIPTIVFPAACPIFETDPTPTLFLNGNGGIEARLNMPKVQLGLGETITYDSKNIFPVSYSLHLLPDEEKKVTDDMLDFSGEVNLYGGVTSGIRFRGNIATASWFKKVLLGDVRLQLDCGPKLYGRIQFTQDVLNGSGFSTEDILGSAYLEMTLLNFNLSAKAKAAAFWNDPVEKTFFEKNWAFLTDTVFFSPKFKEPAIESDDDSLSITLRLEPKHVIGYTKMQIGIYDYTGVEYLGQGRLVDEVGDFTLKPGKYNYTYTFTPEEIKDFKVQKYYAVPRYDWASYHDLQDIYHGIEFVMPFYMQMDKDSLVFDALGTQTQSVTFTTNCPKDQIDVYGGEWVRFDTLLVLNEQEGKYKAVFHARRNDELFDRSLPKDTESNPAIVLHAPIIGTTGSHTKLYEIGAYQQQSDLSNVALSLSAFWENEEGLRNNVQYAGNVTATRQGNDAIVFEGAYEEDLSQGDSYYIQYAMTQNVHLRLTRTKEVVNGVEKYVFYSDGTLSQHWINEIYKSTHTQDWFVQFSRAQSDNYCKNCLEGDNKLTAGTYDEVKTIKPGYSDTDARDHHEAMQTGANNRVSIQFFVNAPSGQ